MCRSQGCCWVLGVAHHAGQVYRIGASIGQAPGFGAGTERSGAGEWELGGGKRWTKADEGSRRAKIQRGPGLAMPLQAAYCRGSRFLPVRWSFESSSSVPCRRALKRPDLARGGAKCGAPRFPSPAKQTSANVTPARDDINANDCSLCYSLKSHAFTSALLFFLPSTPASALC